MDGLKITKTTPMVRRVEGLVYTEGSAPETQTEEQNTLEGLISKEPLGHLLQLIHTPY